MRGFFLFIIFILLAPSCALTQEVRTADDLIAAVKRKDANVWRQFSDFDKVLAQMNGWESKLYEEAHGDVFARKDALLKRLDDEKRVVEFDRMAFLKAYPHLSAAFERSDVRWRFEQDFVRRFSYGWKRMMALRRGQLAVFGQRSAGGSFKRVRLDETQSLLVLSLEDTSGVQRLWSWHFSLLYKLAVCQGYQAAIRDIIKSSQEKDDLQLSPVLSYLLWLRAKQKGVQLVDEKKWQAEIDKTLSLDEKKRYKGLIEDNAVLMKNLSFCSD